MVSVLKRSVWMRLLRNGSTIHPHLWKTSSDMFQTHSAYQTALSAAGTKYMSLEWGEYPHVIKSKIQKWNKKSQRWNRTRLITDEIISALSTIIDESPELYLDEIAEELAINTGIHLSLSKLYCTIKQHPNYSLQVCYESAKQRDEID